MSGISYLKKKKKAINNVVIVYPFTYINPYYCLPPIAAEYLQAGILEAGKNVTLLDMRFEVDIKEHLEKADLVCFYGYFEDCSIFGKWQVDVISEVLEQIPSEIPIIAGGTAFSEPEEALKKYPGIDIIIRGNPEIPIMELLRENTPENITNLAYRKNGKVVNNLRVIHKLSEDIFPRRNLRNKKYRYHLVGIKIDLIRSAVGCNYKCKFCFQYGKDTDGTFLRWQGRSPESLFKELSEIEAPIVILVDDDMTTDMNILERLADMLIESNIKKLYIGTGRLDHILKGNVETLRKLERAGLIALAFGVESLKKETLEFYGKGHSIEKIEEAMRMINKTNILLACNFLFGSPGETEKDMMEYLWFGRKWDVDTIVTNRLRVDEGSPMYNLIYDSKTGKEKPGMERLDEDELAIIKYRVKYAQRTPFRVLLIFLKLYRHKGMFVDPIYFLCSTIETVIQHTWLERIWFFKALLNITKKIVSIPMVRSLTRLLAFTITPPVRLINRAFEFVDRKLGISTFIVPELFHYLYNTVYKRQKIRAQFGHGRPIN